MKRWPIGLNLEMRKSLAGLLETLFDPDLNELAEKSK
jgi:hypothetical protein